MCLCVTIISFVSMQVVNGRPLPSPPSHIPHCSFRTSTDFPDAGHESVVKVMPPQPLYSHEDLMVAMEGLVDEVSAEETKQLMEELWAEVRVGPFEGGEED